MRKLIFLSFGFLLLGSLAAEPIKENIGLYGGQVSDIEAVNRSGSTELIIAVDSSQRGVFRWHPTAARWGSVTNPIDSTITGHIPGSAALVEANPKSATDVYATLTWNSSGMFSQLHVSDNYGDLDPNVSWTESLDTSGASISDVTALVGHSSGMYAGTRDGNILLNAGAATDAFSAVFTHPSGDEIIAFAVASSTLGYVVSSSSGVLNLYSTDWGGTDTNLTANLPAKAPVELHTGTCPITSCPLEINLIGVDPIKTDGKTIFIAGSSTNGQAFKSTDGGISWNSGWDYQCGLATSGCAGYRFTDGFPRQIRFRGATASGTESRNVFISRVVMDQDDTAPIWHSIPNLESTIQPSGPSGPTITISTNANDSSLAIDPIDSSILYIATDLAIGEVEHIEGSGYASPSGFEKGNALGIDGLVVNGLDYYENSPTDKEFYVVAKSGIAFAKGYNPSDPTSVATRDGWVFPIYPLGDGAPPGAVKFDPSDKTLVLVGNGKVYRNPTADGAVSLTDVATNWTRVFDSNDSAFSGPGMPLESDRVERSYTTAIDWETAGGVCDRVYMTMANTDTGTEGGVFYSDDKGLTWAADTLSSGGLLKMPVNTISGVSESSLFPIIGVGDFDGRSAETGIYRRVSYCLSQDWSKPSHTSDVVFDEIQTKVILAIDALSARPSSSAIDAIMFIVAHDAVYRGQLNSSSATTETGWNKWDFSDVTPPGGMGFTDVAMEPNDTDHVWVAYDNCIQESTDGGLTWNDYSTSCQPDHEVIKVLVYDDLIAGSAGGAYAYVEISLSAVTIEENSAGITVGTLTPTSDSYTYSLSGDDAGLFVVSGVELSLAESVAADYETQQSYSITVTASDSLGNSTDQDFTITVVDVNESPSDVSLSATSVAESEAGASIGTLSATDPDANETLTFSLSGDDADSLEISGTTLKLKDSVTADYGTKSSYSITAVVTDSSSNTAEAAFTISVTETPDSDGDGVDDNADAFPTDATETLDTDGDGVGNNADTDDDDDGVADSADAYPLISLGGRLDTDSDGRPNDCDSACTAAGMTADTDDDGDGVEDSADLFPLNGLYSLDSDSDGMPDAWETKYGLDPNDASDATSDQDNDGVTALDEFLAGTIPSGSLDIDGNAQYDALTDGLLLLRGMFGLDGDALVTGTVASDASYTESVDIESRIATLGELADIDGNGDIDALTDGLLTLRYLFGLQGDTLINGVVAEDATRTTAEEIEAHLETLMPAL